MLWARSTPGEFATRTNCSRLSMVNLRSPESELAVQRGSVRPVKSQMETVISIRRVVVIRPPKMRSDSEPSNRSRSISSLYQTTLGLEQGARRRDRCEWIDFSGFRAPHPNWLRPEPTPTIFQERQFSLEKSRVLGHNRRTFQSFHSDRRCFAGGVPGDPP